MQKIIDKISIQPVPDDWQKQINIIEYSEVIKIEYCAFFYYHFLFEKKSIANRFKKELINACLCNDNTYHGVSRKLNLVTLGCYLTEVGRGGTPYCSQKRLLESLKLKIKDRSDKLFKIYAKYQSNIVKVIFTQSYD